MREHIAKVYKVGARNSKSLGVVIPSEIVKQENLDNNTVFVVKCRNRRIVFYHLDIPVDLESRNLQSTGIDY
jgi:antitoxin component of MazEF toxin-antitoxin module